jgi:chaperonin GroEL
MLRGCENLADAV